MQFSTNKRFHDKLYLNENQYINPKEYFKFASQLIDELNIKNKIKLLDIGCAAGDFLKYLILSKNQELFDFYGTDVSEELLEASKKNVPEAKFFKCDFSKKHESFENIISQKFDIITMMAVHTCFDNLDWISNIYNLLNSQGVAILWGIFNPYPYDVLIRVKESDSTNYQSGWNVHSIKSVIKEANKQDLKLEIVNYQPELNIKRNSKDFLRSWTINLADNNSDRDNIDNQILLETERKIIYTNATRIIHDYCFCKLFKK